MLARPFVFALSLALAAVAQASGYRITTVDTPGTDATFVLDINDSGQWAGYAIKFDASLPGGGAYTGLTGMANGSGITALTRAGAYSIGASGINSAGAISGVSVDGSFNAAGFVRSPGGTYSTINPSLGGITSAYSEAVDLNGLGTVVGFYNATVPATEQESSANSHGFILQGGVYSTFDAPVAGAYGTQLYSVNDQGTISGRYLTAGDVSHGFLYNPGLGFVDLSIPGLGTEVEGLNNRGDFASIIYLDPTNPYAVLSFINSGGVSTPFSVDGALATIAYGLNDRGQVVGLYADSNFALHGFIATPTPGPVAAAPFLLGLLRRRRRSAKHRAGASCGERPSSLT